MSAKAFRKGCVKGISISSRRPTCTVVLLILGMLAGTGMADSSAIGTWDGSYISGSSIGIVFNWNLTAGSSVTGCWEEPLGPWGLSGTANLCVSGTYSYNSQTGVLGIEASGWIYDIQGYDVNADLSVTGTIIGDSASGSSELWLYIYLNGDLVDSDYGASTWQATRTSTPAKPTNPNPSSAATNQSMIVDLSWSNGGGATSYDVYFGTDSTPDSGEYKGNQSGTSYNPGTLACSTTYYWRIDAKNSNGTTTGDVWSFTTGSAIYVDGVNGSDSAGTGVQALPFKTVQKAMEVASNGCTIIILAGTYLENITMNKAVTIQAQSGLVRIGLQVPDNMVWVTIADPGVSGHEGFVGQISKYETTNAQYCEYLNVALASGDIIVDGSYVEGANGSNSGADFVGEEYYYLTGSGSTFNGATNGGAARINYTGSSFTVDSGFENHPVTYVSWYGSTAFCNHYGWRLPTEWEWQAVADHEEEFIYGCGPTINNSIANYRDSTHPNGTTIAGSFGTYGYGMCDMAGNVYEWTNSWYSDSQSYRVLRGGSWRSYSIHCTVSYRLYNSPNESFNIVGFRICR